MQEEKTNQTSKQTITTTKTNQSVKPWKRVGSEKAVGWKTLHELLLGKQRNIKLQDHGESSNSHEQNGARLMSLQRQSRPLL
uniref:Uncharacterized protein n=1 Tax=Mus musculus TaxID=10090 RepID=Q3UP06_MOUSE|nr:unnamed protein product [Mus musculus]